MPVHRLATAGAMLLVLAVHLVPPAAAQRRLTDFLSALDPASASDQGWREIERYVERLGGRDRSLILRPTARSQRRVELWNAPDGAYAVHDGDDLFPVAVPTAVRVTDADPEEDHVEVDLRTPDGRRGRISFYGAPPSVAVFRTWMDEIFEVETPEAEFERYFVDLVTGTLHARGSEHRLPPAERTGYSALADFSADEHTRCMVCFQPPPPVRDWEQEERMQREVLEHLLPGLTLVGDRRVHAVLQEMGEEILAAWPAPLKGYAYEFLLFESPQINAFAVPGGRIFIASGLVAAIESEPALKAVIAHEIAHVESRHSYRIARGRRAAQAGTGFLDLLRQRNPGSPAGTVADGVGILLGAALMDYGRDREREADLFASVFFGLAGQDQDAMTSTFRILRDARERAPAPDGGGLLDGALESLLASHPSVYERLDRAENTLTATFDDYWVFHGLNRRGARVATVRFRLQQAYDDALNVLVAIDTTEALGRRDNVNNPEVRLVNGRRLRFSEQTAEAVEPGAGVAALFSTGDAAGLITAVPQELRLNLRNVDRWVRARR